jgi:hypothetical protein
MIKKESFFQTLILLLNKTFHFPKVLKIVFQKVQKVM